MKVLKYGANRNITSDWIFSTLNIICLQGKCMDAKQIARGIVDGISSMPGLMHHGVIRTWQEAALQVVLLGTETSERQSVLSGLSDLWEVKKNPYAV